MPKNISHLGSSLAADFARYADRQKAVGADVAIVDETMGYYLAKNYVVNVLLLTPKHLDFQIANGLVTPEGLAKNIKILGNIAAKSNDDSLATSSAECIAAATTHITWELGGFRHRQPFNQNINQKIEWYLMDWLGLQPDARSAANPVWLPELVEVAPAVVRTFVKNGTVRSAETYLHDLLGYRPENAFPTESVKLMQAIAILANACAKTVDSVCLRRHAGAYVLCMSSLPREMVDTVGPINTANIVRSYTADFDAGDVFELVKLHMAIKDSPRHMEAFAQALSSNGAERAKLSVMACLELMDACHAQDMSLYQQKFYGLLTALGYSRAAGPEPKQLPAPPARLAALITPNLA